LDNLVSANDEIIGLSTFLAAGGSSSSVPPIHTVSSGNAILSSAWDATNKKGVTSTQVDMSDTTTCMLASTSKLLTWTALSMMLDADKFDLDDDINDALLPLNFQVRNPRFPFAKVTYRHLYAHTSGIKDSWDGYFYGNEQCPADPMDPYPESLAKTMKDGTSNKSNWYNSRPGAFYDYSNYGTAIGALLVEQHSG
jgi:CubicO group peptidase (beta-lactamase class C family)